MNSFSDKIKKLQSLMPSPIMVSLDLDDPKKALDLAQQLKSEAGAFKIGPRLLLRGGPKLAKELASFGPLFVDFKFFDIPSTTEAAVEAAFELGATFVTVHALSGRKCLEGISKLEARLNQKRPFQILGVTILTSFAEGELSVALQQKSITSLVQDLSQELHLSGISGLVCSAHELESLKSFEFFKVTPGIRMPLEISDKLGNGNPFNVNPANVISKNMNSKNDQARTMTPKEAIRLGSHGLVVGRPILLSPDPSVALKEMIQGL